MVLRVLRVDEHDSDVEDHEDGVGDDEQEDGHLFPVLLKRLQSNKRIRQNFVGLVPLHQQYYGDNADQVAYNISADPIPDPNLVIVLVMDDADKICDESIQKNYCQANHNAHAVEVFVHFQFEDDCYVDRNEYEEQGAQRELDWNAGGELFVWRNNWLGWLGWLVWLFWTKMLRLLVCLKLVNHLVYRPICPIYFLLKTIILFIQYHT